jgi:hypothetical protein
MPMRLITQLGRCLSRNKGLLIAAVCVWFGGGGAATALAQCPPTWVNGIGTIGTTGGTGQINAIVPLSNGDVLIGGSFDSVNGVVSHNLIGYDLFTGQFFSTDAGAAGGFNGAVTAIAEIEDGSGAAAVVGAFTQYASGGAAAPTVHVARYDGFGHVGMLVAPASNLAVSGVTPNAVATLGPNKVVIGGAFLNAAGIAAADNIIVRNLDTQTWEALGPGKTGAVNALLRLPGGDLIAGGSFSGPTGNRVSRYAPATGLWSAIGSGTTSGTVWSLSLLESGDLMVGGQFNGAGSVVSPNLVRCNPATGVWSACGGGGGGLGGTVYAMLPLPLIPNAPGASGTGGEVLLGGDHIATGVPNSGALNRYSVFANAFNPGFGDPFTIAGTVRAMARLPGGDVLIGGLFDRAGGFNVHNLARLTPGAALPMIVAQPVPVNTYRSGTAFLCVAAFPAVGTGQLIYQWRKDGVPISAATNPSAAMAVLTLTNVQQGDLGLYDCAITNSCGGTGVTTAAVAVSFVVDPCPADMGVQGGGFGHDGLLDNNDFIAFIDKFFGGCTP